MERTQKEKPGFPIGLVALFAILTTGIIAEKNIHLEGSRPENKTENLIEGGQENKINSRLWQDPFESVNYYLKNKSDSIQKINKKSNENFTLSYTPSQKNPKDSGEPYLPSNMNKKSTEDITISKAPSDELEEKNDLINLIEEINGWSAKDKKVTVLGVMVPSEFYFQDIEYRQRVRYATLSGLGVKGFEPEDSNHIRLIKNIYNWPEFVPYEIFKSNKKGENKKILVFWLLDSYFNDLKNGKKVPLRRLLEWVNEFNPKANAKVKSSCVDEINPTTSSKDKEKDDRAEYIKKYRCEFEKTKDWSFKLIGPSTSGLLGAMVTEAMEIKKKQKNEGNSIFKRSGHPIEIFNVRATIDEDLILKQVEGTEKKNERDTVYELFQKKFIKPENDDEFPFVFIRTIPTDGELAKLIIKELGKRSIGNAKNGKNSCPGGDRVALISEWDTAYGRSFQKTMNNNKNGAHLCFEHFSYQRGIDGQVPGSKKNSKSNSEVKSQNQNSNNAELQNQFDYLIRLSDQIKNQSPDGENFENSGDFKAFGILGSDFYDKLSVLKTLRKRFPGRVFFTTDLDARYFHRHEFPTVRNLLVASGFDLKLNRIWQKDIPPFRDGYQTATFFAVQLALTPKIEKNFSDQHKGFDYQDRIDSFIDPQIFEIGRNQAFPLIKDDWLESDWKKWIYNLFWGEYNKTFKDDIKSAQRRLQNVDTDEKLKDIAYDLQTSLLEIKNLQSILKRVHD